VENVGSLIGSEQISWNAKVAAWSVRTFLKPLLRPPVPIVWQRRILSAMMALFPKPSGVTRYIVTLGGIEAEKLVPKGYAEREDGRMILYWHGGGYGMGSAATHRSLAMHIAAQTNLPVIVPNYRLAPEHCYPAQINDAARCLRALQQLGTRSDQVILAGDSAGGNLALELALYCRDQGLAAPRGMILVSPWFDVLAHYDEQYHGDALVSAAWIHQLQKAYVPESLRNGGFRPTVEANLDGLPPTLIQYTSIEMLAPEVRALGAKMHSAGVKVTMDEAPGLWHDFQMHAGLVPEATRAVQRIAAFVKRLG
jgi:acetyl esterase/lipase